MHYSTCRVMAGVYVRRRIPYQIQAGDADSTLLHYHVYRMLQKDWLLQRLQVQEALVLAQTALLQLTWAVTVLVTDRFLACNSATGVMSRAKIGQASHAVLRYRQTNTQLNNKTSRAGPKSGGSCQCFRIRASRHKHVFDALHGT